MITVKKVSEMKVGELFWYMWVKEPYLLLKIEPEIVSYYYRLSVLKSSGEIEDIRNCASAHRMQCF